jgi:tetratricopeptide (TPR) repeat protein
MFRAFKKGVANLVSPEESSVHYDLGMAYKEMGLVDDAIGEFQTAMSGSSSPSNCMLMIGLCQVDRGQLAEAIACLHQALRLKGLGENEAAGLYFELGKIYCQSEDLPRARWAFEQAQNIDPGFQDVARKLVELAEVAPLPPEAPAAEAEATPAVEEAAAAEPAPEPPVRPGPAKEEGSRETAALSEPEPREAEPEAMKQAQKKSRKISYV